MSIDPMTMALSKGKVFDLSEYGINLYDQITSGEKVHAISCTQLLDEVSEVIIAKRLPILFDPSCEIYMIPASVSTLGQISMSMTGSMGDGDGGTVFIKADAVILPDGVYMFSEQMA